MLRRWSYSIGLLLATSSHPFILALSNGPSKHLTASDGKSRISHPLRRQRSSNQKENGATRNRAGFVLRTDGVKTGKRVKPPKWETEGDALYSELASNGVSVNLEEARTMLASLSQNLTESSFNHDERSHTHSRIHNYSQSTDQADSMPTKARTPPIGTMWGSLSVGPILRAHLVDRAGLERPTTVQEAAFDVILKGKNVVIASPTGTGKSLSYLVPLLCRFGLRTPSIAIILTPTIELALQLQRELDQRLGINAIQVIDDPFRSDDVTEETLLSTIGMAPILAGTPKSFRRLFDEAKERTKCDVLGACANSLLLNPKCIVLDEADRLLKTEHLARQIAETATNAKSKSKVSRKTGSRSTTTVTESVLRELPLSRLQLVCVSATVGRTLRTQIMNILDAPSIEKACVLVTADDRNKKDMALRRASWTPSGISHWYRLLPGESNQSHDIDKSDDETATNDSLCKANEMADAKASAAVQALWDTMQQVSPGVSIIFPGRVGVARVQSILESFGLKQVRTLRQYVGNTSAQTAKESSASALGWEDTIIYVVGEKFGRGLDLPNVDNVFLMTPPSSAAAYAHLAGRTGRNHRKGKAIMLVRPMEAHKVVAIADALGLSFRSIDSM